MNLCSWSLGTFWHADHSNHGDEHMPDDLSQQGKELVLARKPVAPLPDYYVENGLLVYTPAYHLKRGHCCGSGCRHCPYQPRHVAGTKDVMRTPAARYNPGQAES